MRLHFIVVAVIAFALDRIAKVLVREEMQVGERIELVGSLLALQHVHNPGIAFGMFAGMGGIVVIGTLVVGVLLFTFLMRVEPEDRLTLFGGALITGGAIGNLVDRVEQGYVTDYINVPNFPTFNIADMCITIGVIMVILAQLVAIRDEYRASREADDSDQQR